MCSGQWKVGGLHLSALLLEQTAELQANKPHYHHHHQQQISLQQLSAVHITALTVQTCTYLESSTAECFALKDQPVLLYVLKMPAQPNYKNIFSLVLLQKTMQIVLVDSANPTKYTGCQGNIYIVFGAQNTNS